MTVADPVRDERGWAFHDGPGYSADPVNGFEFLAAGLSSRPTRTSTGARRCRCSGTRKRDRIVNNSEDDICRMFNDAFAGFGAPLSDLFPPDLAAEQAELSQHIYERINNGVYRAGFATRQRGYEYACRARLRRAR